MKRSKRILSAVLSLLMAGNMAMQSVPASALHLQEKTGQAQEQTLLPEGNILFKAEDESEPEAPEATEAAESPESGNTVSDACGPAVTWTLDLDTHVLTISGSGTMTDMTHRTDKWLSYAEQVEAIVIEPGITVPSGIFDECTALQRITMPLLYDPEKQSTFPGLFRSGVPENFTSVTLTDGERIPENYFEGCSMLTEILLPETVTEIGANAFRDCSGLTEIQLPAQLKVIGNGAFAGCTGFTSVTLPDGLQTIGSNAFAYCGGLTEFTIPDSVTVIGEDVLNGNEVLTSLTLPFAGNLTSVHGELESDAHLSTLFDGYLPETLTTLTITGGTVIPENYLLNCTALTSVTMPSGITEIGSSAFRNCTGLTAVTIPKTVQTIGASAFEGCTGLKKISIPASVRTIGDAAFCDCTALTAVTFHEGLVSIGESAFRNCTGIKNFKFPASLQSIGSNALAGCPLTTLTIPDGVTYLGEAILGDNTTLTEVTLPAAAYDYSFKGILTGRDILPETLTKVTVSAGTVLPAGFFYGCELLTTILLPDTLTTIGSEAFYGCAALGDGLSIPDSVYAIGTEAFVGTPWYDAQENGIVYAGKVAIGSKGRAPENDLVFADGTTGIADCAFYNTDITSVKFPETLVNIGYRAFYSCDNLTAVTLPDSVQTVGDGAFMSCSQLAAVSVPDTVSQVGEAVFDETAWISSQKSGEVYVGTTFYGYKGTMPHNTVLTLREDCTAISKNALNGCEDLVGIVLPDGLVSIGESAFRDCTSLQEITLPDSVRYIGEAAFCGCKMLQNVTVPSGVTTLHDGVFSDCTGLETVVLPASVTKIGYNTFYNCTAINELTIPGTLLSIEYNAFDCDSSEADYLSDELNLIIADGSTSVSYDVVNRFRARATEITLPETLTDIGESAFADFSKITTVPLPTSLTTIGEDAFRSCTALTELKFPANVTVLPEYLCEGCTALTKVTLPAKVQRIDRYAFAGCTALTALKCPASLQEIGRCAFLNCSGMKTLSLGSGLKTIRSEAFNGCSKLAAVVIPDGTEYIDDYAFYNCTAAKSVTVPDTLKEVGSDIFGITMEEDTVLPKRTLVVSDASTAVTHNMTRVLGNTLQTAVLPETVKTVDEYAFSECESLTSLTIPEGVESIGNAACSYCPSLTEVVLPATVTEIPDRMLYQCNSLKTVTIPDSVTAIGKDAFAGCVALQSVSIPDSVVSIGQAAFDYCTGLKQVKLSSGLETIPAYMFRNCTMLNSISIPEKTTAIGSCAFYNCRSLSEIEMYDYVSEFGSYAFGHDTDMLLSERKLVLAEGSVRITNAIIGALSDSITSVSLPNTLREITDGAFRDCTALTTLTIPESVTTIGEGAFRDCAALTSVTIPGGVKRLNSALFYNCPALKEVTLPSSITVIPEYTFADCGELSAIHLDKEKVKFHPTAFRNCYSLYDPRFCVLDKQNVEFFANQTTIGQDGLVNLTLQYKLNDKILDDDNYTIYLHVPDGTALMYNSLAADSDAIEISGNTVAISTQKAADAVKFAVKLQEYGAFRFTASIGVRFNGDAYEEAIGYVDVSAPEISVNVPDQVNTASFAVRGLAIPGETVTIYVDDAEAATAVASENTGVYSATVTVPEKEEGQKFTVYAAIPDHTSNVAEVMYCPSKPMVERVLLGYNGCEPNLDITSAFTEGRHPTISFNPSYPFQFDLELSVPERVGAVYVTSTKGSDVKRIRAYWIPEKGIWSAYGYFDPDNHRYVPGTLNVSILEQDNVVVNMEDGTIQAPQNVLDTIFNEEGTEKNKVEEINTAMPEEITQNTTSEVTYQTDDSILAEVNVSNGKQSEDMLVYAENTDQFCIDGQYVSLEDIYKNPGAYGFERSGVSVTDGNSTYSYLVRPVAGTDAGGQVLESMRRHDPTGSSYSESDIRNGINFCGGTGTQMIEVRESNDNKDGNGGGFDLKGTAEFVTATGDLLFNKGYTYTWNAVTKDWQMTKEMAEFKWAEAGTAGKAFKVVGNVFNVINTVDKGATWIGQLSRAQNGWDVASATGLYAARMVNTWVLPDVLAKAGFSVGMAVGGPVGALIGAFIGGVVLPIVFDKLLDLWEDHLNGRLGWDGQFHWLIDPSGYVYEAVTSNRVAGAKMTVFYLDPDTGEEKQWTADDYDQKNPLYTDENGEYAWDVPEGRWRVCFELEGYETVYTDWMDVPPIQTDVNISVKSLADPAIAGIVAADNCVILTFTQYMDIQTINDKTVTLYAGADQTECRILPMLADEQDAYALSFVLEPVDGAFPAGDLTAVLTDGCKSYNGKSLPEQSAVAERPVVLTSIKANTAMMIVSKDSESVFTVKALPAELAAGKKLVVSDPQNIVLVSGEPVFDETGTATVTFRLQRTGLTNLTFHAEGEELTGKITIVSVTAEEKLADQAAGGEAAPVATEPATESTEPALQLGDLNGDESVNASDAAMILIAAASAGAGNGYGLTDAQTAVADINGKDGINASDAAVILIYSAAFGAGQTTLDLAEYLLSA